MWLAARRLPKTRRGAVDRATLRRETTGLLQIVGLAVDRSTRLGFLGVVQRQLVEITKVIAMDEPTSVARQLASLCPRMGHPSTDGTPLLDVRGLTPAMGA